MQAFPPPGGLTMSSWPIRSASMVRRPRRRILRAIDAGPKGPQRRRARTLVIVNREGLDLRDNTLAVTTPEAVEAAPRPWPLRSEPI